MIINPYRYAGGEILLLDHPDVFGITVSAAYSPYKRRAAYTGDAIRVRRSVDSVEQDIGFVGNELDTAALLAFVGAGSGFTTLWYDQSTAARNLSTTIQADQPRGVNSGSLETLNGQPTLRWLLSQLNFPAGFTQTLPTTVYAVVDTTALGPGHRVFMQRTSVTSTNLALFLGASTGDYKPYVYWAGAKAIWGTPVQRSAIVRWRLNSTETAVRVDDATEVTGASATDLTEWTSVGLSTIQQLNDVPISELLICTSTVDAAADAAIMADYNARYGVY